MRVGIAHLPGALVDETTRAVRLAGGQAVALWHASADLEDVDAVVIPGGQTYGNYLRPGGLAATARSCAQHWAPPARGCPCSAWEPGSPPCARWASCQVRS